MTFLYRKAVVTKVVMEVTRVIVITKAVAVAVVNKAETQDLAVVVMTRMIRVIAIKVVMTKVVTIKVVMIATKATATKIRGVLAAT